MRDKGSLKYLVSLGAPVLAIIIFYLLRDQDCLAIVRWLGWLYSWFWLAALVIAGLVRLIGYAFIEEIGD